MKFSLMTNQVNQKTKMARRRYLKLSLAVLALCASGLGSTVDVYAAAYSAGGGTATGTRSVAIGDEAEALVGSISDAGGYSSAFGNSAKATASASTALGYAATASAVGSLAVGAGSTAKHESSVAIGRGSVTSEANSVSVGASTSSTRSIDITIVDSIRDAAEQKSEII